MRPSHRRNNAMWPRRRMLGQPTTPLWTTSVLKELYPEFGSPEMERPWPFKLARHRGWITSHAYWDVKPVPTGRVNPGITESMYENSPFFSMLKKNGTASAARAGW